MVLRHGSGKSASFLAHPLVLAIVCTLVLVAVAWISPMPEVRGTDAEESEFSAIRAKALLDDLLQESVPHVVGSEANRRVRDRIISHLKRFGYQPEVQNRFHCNVDFASCATVENIIAWKSGADHRDAILLTAHYDSDWSAPGAGDDGAGVVAVLEIARMMAEYGELHNDIIFLFTDGEERGLIGADAFAAHHPLFNKVAVVINLDARGVTGPSTMYETGEGNRSLIRIMSKHLTRPVANSLAYEIYKRMPNNTDYSVYRKHGVMGLNFAFTGGAALYHSALDDGDHLDLRSLQHHGDNAWSLVRELIDRNIGHLTSREDAAFIDVFGRLLWHYPQSIATGATFVAAVLVFLGISFRFPREKGVAMLAWALLGQVTAIVVLIAGAWLLSWPLGHWVDSHPIEHPAPWVGRLSILAMVPVAIWCACKLLAHKIPFGAATLMCWMSFAALAIWLSFQIPAASFYALLPLTAFLIGLILDFLTGFRRTRLGFAALFGLITASYLAFNTFIALDVVLSFDQSHLKAAPLVLVLLPLLPAWFGHFDEPIPGWKPGIPLIGFAAVTAVLQSFVPGYTEDRPRGMNLVYREVQGQPEAMVLVATGAGRADAEYVGRHGFELQSVPGPWSSPSVQPFSEVATLERYAIETPSVPLQGTDIRILGSAAAEDGEGWWHRLELRPPPGAGQIVVAFSDPSPVVEARVQGLLALDSDVQPLKGSKPRVLVVTYPDSPVRLEVRTETAEPFFMAVSTRRGFPETLLSRLSAGWPPDAQNFYRGTRAQIITEIEVDPQADE